MTQLRVSETAEVMGVSADTVRRWVDTAKLPTIAGSSPLLIEGTDLAAFAVREANDEPTRQRSSARNQFSGLVTRVVQDTVMAQVELQCGKQRVVSLMSAEAVDALGLKPGVRATASIKATQVVIGLDS